MTYNESPAGSIGSSEAETDRAADRPALEGQERQPRPSDSMRSPGGRWVSAKSVVPRVMAARGARRLGWGIIDQGLSSLTNLVVSLSVARTLGAEQFGAFSLAYVTY